MTTTIHSNGSKWAGQEPDTIDVLLIMLAEHPLDRSFEVSGDFVQRNPEAPSLYQFFGNFFAVSHAFNIDTDDQKTASRLILAIRANQKRGDYLSQTCPHAEKRAKEEDWARNCLTEKARA